MAKEVDVFIAGIGGQGSLLIGQILSEAAIKEGFNTTWVPIYGVEKRGGDATVTVIISDEEIGSPVLDKVNNMVIMHQRMWDKYNHKLKEGGLLIINSSIVEVNNINAEVIKVPATEIAVSLGTERVTNMVLLGVLLKKLRVVSPDSIKEIIESKSKNADIASLNLKAFEEGYNFL